MTVENTLFGSDTSRWQVWAALIVLVGSAVTVAYVIVENFWG